MSFNDRHPEKEYGEMWSMNEGENSTSTMTFDNLPYATKRLGKIAYNDNGEVLPNMRPIFIKKNEFESRAIIQSTKKAYLVGTNSMSFRPGEPAEIIGVVFIQREAGPRACYHVKYEDGFEDLVAILDKENYYIAPVEMLGVLEKSNQS